MSELTVLIANRISNDHVVYLRERFPQVSFIHLPADGAVPPEGVDAEVLLRCGMPKDALRRTMAGAPNLVWLHTCTAGFDWLMIPEVMERQLRITRTSDAYNTAIAEFVLSYILFAAKRYPHLLQAQARRQWLPPDPDELTGQTVGIIGAGSIGREVARRCKAFGMRTLGIKRTAGVTEFMDHMLSRDELPSLLQQSDYVVLACPLTTETRGIIGREQLRQMKPTAQLINIARGALIVETALMEAMREGWIAGACLDAFEQEPLSADSPLWTLPNVVVTPHFSYKSPLSMDRIAEEFAVNLERFMAGRPLNNPLKDAVLGY